MPSGASIKQIFSTEHAEKKEQKKSNVQYIALNTLHPFLPPVGWTIRKKRKTPQGCGGRKIKRQREKERLKRINKYDLRCAEKKVNELPAELSIALQ